MDYKGPTATTMEQPAYAPQHQQQTPHQTYQQPQQPQQPMTYKPETSGVESDWSSSLFDCFTGADNLCLKATFCSCFVYGKNVARLRDPSLANYERFNGDCIGFGALQGCCALGWVLSMGNRSMTRQRFRIQGDGCTDCLSEYFCTCCSLIQVEKEIIARSSTGQGGYVQQPGMVAGPM